MDYENPPFGESQDPLPTHDVGNGEGFVIDHMLGIVHSIHSGGEWRNNRILLQNLVIAMNQIGGVPSVYFLDHEEEYYREIHLEVSKFIRSMK